MPYQVRSSEKLRKSGAEFETKAMLYLMNFRETLIKAFPSPDLRCNAANSFANPCDPPEAAKEMLN